MNSHERSPLSQLDITRIRRWLLILTALLLWLSSGIIAKVAADDTTEAADDYPVVKRVVSQSFEQHGITITPAPSREITINGLTYNDVYDSIPYHRADALANPGYRHDATMEILFGEMRPTTIVRHMPQPTASPGYLRPVYGFAPYGPYLRGYPFGVSTFGLSAYRWSIWDQYLHRHSSFMFGVR